MDARQKLGSVSAGRWYKMQKERQFAQTTVHGTCVAFNGRAVLLRGASGAGKSDLALRLIKAPLQPWQLISDDQVRLCRNAGRLWATAPPVIAGQLEVRGVGVIAVPFAENLPLALVAELVAPDQVPRLPEDPLPQQHVLGIALPHLKLDPFASSAILKLRLALDRFAY